MRRPWLMLLCTAMTAVAVIVAASSAPSSAPSGAPSSVPSNLPSHVDGRWIDQAASGTLAAAEVRGVATDPGCAPPVGVPASARQVVVVRPDPAVPSMASVDLLVDAGRGWGCVLTDLPARVGRNGLRPLAERRSGDGTTPSGVFPLATATAPDGTAFQFFGNGPDPGVQGGWRQVRAGDCWVATPFHPEYNTLVTRAAGACTSPDEYLASFGQAYSAAALIGANMGPERSGDAPSEAPLAAAIFLHRHSYDAAGRTRPTSGCVSLAADDLAVVLRALHPGDAWFAIG